MMWQRGSGGVLQILWGILPCFGIPFSEPLTTIQKLTYLSILPRRANEYSGVTLRVPVVILQAKISCIATLISNIHQQTKKKSEIQKRKKTTDH